MAADARGFTQIKTLHVDCGRTMGGGQWQVLYLIAGLRDSDRGSESRLVASPPLNQLAQSRGIEVTAWESWKWADLVHAHDARGHSLAAWRSKGRNPRPFVVSRRVGFPVKRSIVSRWKYRQPRLYLAVSRYVAGELIRAGVDEKTIRVVYDGVPIPKTLSTLEPGRVVALASKPVEIPGVPIHLTSDLWQDLSTASVFVYRSEMEGLGSAALAAMAAGVPVVASKVGGLPEAVEHGRTGLLVDDDNFAPAIRRLLDNPQEGAEMGRRGRERAEKNFTIDIMVQKTKVAYEEALA
jgi:hypothetical protein